MHAKTQKTNPERKNITAHAAVVLLYLLLSLSVIDKIALYSDEALPYLVHPPKMMFYDLEGHGLSIVQEGNLYEAPLIGLVFRTSYSNPYPALSIAAGRKTIPLLNQPYSASYSVLFAKLVEIPFSFLIRDRQLIYRLARIVFGILSLIFLYFLTRRLSGNDNMALMSIILCVTSPFYVIFYRMIMADEGFPLTMLLAGALMFCKAFEKKFSLFFLSGVLFCSLGLSVKLTYIPFALSVPIAVFMLKKELMLSFLQRINFKLVIYSLIIVIAVFSPFIATFALDKRLFLASLACVVGEYDLNSLIGLAGRFVCEFMNFFSSNTISSTNLISQDCFPVKVEMATFIGYLIVLAPSIYIVGNAFCHQRFLVKLALIIFLEMTLSYMLFYGNRDYGHQHFFKYIPFFAVATAAMTESATRRIHSLLKERMDYSKIFIFLSALIFTGYLLIFYNAYRKIVSTKNPAVSTYFKENLTKNLMRQDFNISYLILGPDEEGVIDFLSGESVKPVHLSLLYSKRELYNARERTNEREITCHFLERFFLDRDEGLLVIPVSETIWASTSIGGYPLEILRKCIFDEALKAGKIVEEKQYVSCYGGEECAEILYFHPQES